MHPSSPVAIHATYILSCVYDHCGYVNVLVICLLQVVYKFNKPIQHTMYYKVYL